MDTRRITRRLNQYAPTFLIGGIFLFFSGILYLSLCQLTCDDQRFREREHRELQRVKQVNMPGIASPWQQKGKTLSAYLALAIMTGPDNVERRDAIRQTWISYITNLSEDVMVFFVIGSGNLSKATKKKLDIENHQHHDLLLLTTVNDTYEALTTKLLHSFVWLDHHVDFRFLMKADDDTFARLDVVIEELKTMKPDALYWGFFNGPARVKSKGKWAEKNWVLCDNYLPYTLGGGYVLSADLVNYVASNARFLVKFKSEDVSLGTWLAAVNVNRQHDPRFDTEYLSRGCHNDYIVSHKQSLDDLREKHKNLEETGKLCSKEFRIRKSYRYNWNVPRSQCCERNDPSIP